MRTLALLSLLMAIPVLAACQSTPPEPITLYETEEVLVEVPVRRQPPASLLEEYVPEELPEFVAPDDPLATSALTPAGERALKLIIFDLTTIIDAWRAWATTEDLDAGQRDGSGG